MLTEPPGVLDRSAAPRDLAALYRSWRILDLVGETVAAMPPEWLHILNVARNLLEGHALPGIDLPDDLAKLVADPEPAFTTVVRTERKRRIVYPVTGDTSVQPLRNILDFPQITLPDLMLRTLSRELFDYRLLSGDINGQYNTDAGPAFEEYDQVIEERVPSSAPGRKKRQKVYALLDVSNSMRDDNRIIFAKGLMLAYLVTAAEEQANLYVRTFANTVHARSDCTGPGEFAALAQRVLRVTPDGSTDIKGALDMAIGDIRALDGVNRFERMLEPPPTEILLISDCESYSIPHIPHGIKLHTVHLKSGRMMTAYKEGFEKIRQESKTFHEIDTTAFSLPDTTRDRWLLLQDGRSLESLVPITAPDADPAEVRENTLRRKDLLTAYERMQPPAGRHAGRRDARPGRQGSPSRLDLAELVRAIWLAVRRLFRRPIPDELVTPLHAPIETPFGMHFRARK